MKNACFFHISRQSHFRVNATRAQRRMDHVLVVRRKDYDRFLVVLFDADMPAIFYEARY